MGKKLWTKEEYTKIKEFRKRIWNLFYCLDIHVDEDGNELLLPIEHFPPRSELRPGSPAVRLMEILTETGDKVSNESKDENMKFLRCEINLDAPLKTILSDMEVSVIYLQELKGNPQRKRLSIEVISQDFRALELQLQGKKVEEIAEEIFPAQYDRDEADAMRTVRYGLARIKKMIRGGDI